MLVQQEPDASSFPNGGIRNTFEARGYSAWDPTSPAFIVGGTLCIPTVFIAYTGEALDYKVPLLRSISAVNKAATEVCRYFDKEVNRVIQYLGWEQEYFLVDESLWAVRPDLMLTGRTLMGHESAKNQQLEDHYFGAIPTRVIAFMADLEEAPPAIISTFLGTQVSAVLDKLEASRSDSAIRFNAKNVFKMSGISHIPALLRDNTDRNRTSAFAFTGNRFELRAVGSSDNCAEAMIVLNTAVADEFTAFRERVDARIEAGVRKEKAIYEELKSMIRSSRAIRFDGNGYSEEWRAEAARRGLDCETCAPRVFDRYLDPSSVEMFARMGVLSKVELEARTEVKWETYTKKIQIEGRVLGDLTMNHIVPIASRYEALLLDKVYKISQIGQGLDASADVELIKRIQQHTALIQQLTHDMIEARKVANKIEDQREKALAYHDTVAVYFDQIRKHVDRLEEIVDDQMWPLPKYRELLFLR